MTNQTNTDTENRIFLNGKQLAQVLGVAPPSLTEAVKNGYNCGGYPVGDWAIVSASGRIKGYDVPGFLVSAEKVESRSNPQEKAPNQPNISPNKGGNFDRKTSRVVNNHYSLLPEGEDSVRPIGMVTLPSVLKKALEQDTPQSRAVVAGGLAALGALVGHAVTDNAAGAGVGAGTGLAVALLVYNYFNPSMDGQPHELINQIIKQMEEPLNITQPNLSHFSSN